MRLTDMKLDQSLFVPLDKCLMQTLDQDKKKQPKHQSEGEELYADELISVLTTVNPQYLFLRGSLQQ